MKRLILALVVIFVTSLIVHLPLGLVAQYMPTIPGLSMTQASGTLWHGRFHSVAWNKQQLGSLSWQFRPGSLLLGKLDLDFTLKGQSHLSAKGNAGLSFSGVYLEDVQLDLASAAIDNFIDFPLPISTAGSISFTIADYQASSPWCTSLAGNGQWRNAGLSLPIGQVNVGEVKATLSCQAGSIVVKSTSSSTELATELSISLSPQNRYKIDGYLTATENLPQAIRSQLAWLGTPDQQGRYKLAFSG